MPDPLGDAARRRLAASAASRLTSRGFDVVRPDTRAEPPALAERADVTIGVEPLTAADATPTTIVSRLGHAIDRDRRALFVVADDTVAALVRDVLTDPPLLVAAEDGRRTFHAGPDRIPVDTSDLSNAAGGYACFRVDDLPGVDTGTVQTRTTGVESGGGTGERQGSTPALPPAPSTADGRSPTAPGVSHATTDPSVHWRETDTPIGPVPAVSGVDAAAVGADGRPDVPRLVCEIRGQVVAVLAGVESLRTPPAGAFPHFYRRDPTDKRFRVRRGTDGRVVESVSGFGPMREAGFVPIPMPLVPEHVLDVRVDLGSAWDLLVVDEEQ